MKPTAWTAPAPTWRSPISPGCAAQRSAIITTSRARICSATLRKALGVKITAASPTAIKCTASPRWPWAASLPWISVAIGSGILKPDPLLFISLFWGKNQQYRKPEKANKTECHTCPSHNNGWAIKRGKPAKPCSGTGYHGNCRDLTACMRLSNGQHQSLRPTKRLGCLRCSGCHRGRAQLRSGQRPEKLGRQLHQAEQDRWI